MNSRPCRCLSGFRNRPDLRTWCKRRRSRSTSSGTPCNGEQVVRRRIIAPFDDCISVEPYSRSSFSIELDGFSLPCLGHVDVDGCCSLGGSDPVSSVYVCYVCCGLLYALHPDVHRYLLQQYRWDEQLVSCWISGSFCRVCERSLNSRAWIPSLTGVIAWLT